MTDTYLTEEFCLAAHLTVQSRLGRIQLQQRLTKLACCEAQSREVELMRNVETCVK